MAEARTCVLLSEVSYNLTGGWPDLQWRVLLVYTWPASLALPCCNRWTNMHSAVQLRS
jgi:hypothetical protein